MSKAILVIGGTGNVGRPLVEELVAKGENVKVASRNPEAVRIDGATAVHVDLARPETLEAAFAGVDRAYVLAPAGNADHVGVLGPVIDAAARHRVKVVLQTAIGVNSDDNIPLRQVELRLEKSGVPYVILRPNWFADNFSTYWLHDVLNGEIRVPAGDGKTSFIDTRDIAAAAAAALTTDKFDNQAFDLTGPEAFSYAEAAQMLSAATGRKIGYRSIEDAPFVEALQSAGLNAAYAHMLAAIFYPVREGWTAGTTDAVEKLTGRKPCTLKAYIAENADKFAAKAAA
ncbi:MAG: SDR family oxidoreductase [Rhizobiaceae bacterium]